ncbi:MAG: hypothetical protein V4773_17990 [Verrucomicrobiota bacterium]
MANFFQLSRSAWAEYKKTLSALLLTIGAGLPGTVHGQIEIPVANVQQVSPLMSDVFVTLGDTTRRLRPSPFDIFDVQPYSSAIMWFCLDPLQGLFHTNSAPQHLNGVLDFLGTNPADFDKWTPDAPGLTLARQQMLANLFTQYNPGNVSNNGLLDYASALQLAVWEIGNELSSNPLSLSNGALWAETGQANPALSSNTIEAAQGMLNWVSANSGSSLGNISNLRFLIDGSYNHPSEGLQASSDLAGWISPVPEPAHFTAAGVVALLLVVGVQRRRRQSIARATDSLSKNHALETVLT